MDLVLFLLGLGLFIFVLLIMSVMADSWDSRERRDARRRNR